MEVRNEIKARAIDLKDKLNDALDLLHEARRNRNANEEERCVLRLQLLTGLAIQFMNDISKCD